MVSQVIYQLRLPSDCKFFTFKCNVNVTIKKKTEKIKDLFLCDRDMRITSVTVQLAIESE